MPDEIPADIARWPRITAVRYMARMTLDAAVIAEVIGTTPGVVRSCMSELRRAGEDIPRATARLYPRAAAMEVRAAVPPDLFRRLCNAAKRRRERPQETAKRILTAVIQHDMIDAVLDD